MTRIRVVSFVALLLATDVALGGADAVLRFVLREYGLVAALVWSLLWVTTLGAVATLLLARSKKVYRTAFVVFASILIADFALTATNAAGLTPSMIRATLAESQYASGAARVFVAPAVARALAGAVVVHLLGIAARVTERPSGARAVQAAAVTLAASCALAWLAPWPSWLPRLVAPPFVAGRELLQARPASTREGVRLAPSERAHAAHVVLVIDESIRADVFARATPWLHAHHFTDFGAAAAVANCSAEANRALIGGLRDHELPDRDDAASRHATLFDHAAAAGFATWLLDAQETSTAPPAALAPSDLARLTRHVVLRRGGVAEPEADRALAVAIDEATAGPAPSFVVANKRGAHYPYDAALPAGHPAPTSAAAYEAAVAWTVDGFFAELVPRLRGRDVWLVYLSDHGETLPGEAGPPTHCREAPAPPEQRAVPLVVLRSHDGPEPLLDAIDESAAALRDRASAYQVFPTVLVVLGYDEAAVRDRYGVTLRQAPSARLTFSGDPRGQGPWWRTASE